MAKKAHHNSVTKYALTGLSALGVFAVSTQVANADQVTVKAGDTVWGIAQQHGLTTQGLEAANPTAIKKVNNSVDLIYAGQLLNLSQAQQTANQVQADSTYVVAPGETLSQIAQRFHVSVNSLLAWNHLSSTQLYIGQRLIVNGPAANVFVPTQAAAQPVEDSATADTTATDTTATGSASQTAAGVAAQPVSAPEQSAAANTSAAVVSQQVSESASADQPEQSAAVQSAAPVQASATTSTAVAAQTARPVAAQQTVQAAVQSTAATQQSTAAVASAPASQAQPQSVAGVQSQQSTAAVSGQPSATVQNSTAAQSATAVQANTTTSTAAASETVSQSSASFQAQQSAADQSQAAVSTAAASATNAAPVQTAYSQAAAASSQQQPVTSSAASQPAQASASGQIQSAASATSQTTTAVQSASASQQQSTQAAATAQNQQAQQSQSSNLQNGSVVSLAVKIANSNSVPYVWGGSSLSGMDCSGLVDYVYANAEGKQLPHNTVALESYVNQHSVSEAQSGDILFWGNHGSTYHCAIYIGNNQFVAAAKPGTNVSVYTISKYFEPSFAGTVK